MLNNYNITPKETICKKNEDFSKVFQCDHTDENQYCIRYILNVNFCWIFYSIFQNATI